MIDISMLRISPKLIDVESNRVDWNKFDLDKYKKQELNNDDYSKYIYDKNILSHKFRGLKKQITIDDNGRFPTQLFTNIKNDRYKYVKHIT